MISFPFRLALKSALVQKHRFLSLALTITVASVLLIVLSTLYWNVESQLAIELSGVPNLVVEPEKAIVTVRKLTTDDVLALKSGRHFWRNNTINAVPVMGVEGQLNGETVKVTGTWFDKEILVDNEGYHFGVLNFKGWTYRGEKPGRHSVVLGANLEGKESVEIWLGGSRRVFPVAGILETGSYWDDSVFIDLEVLEKITGQGGLDQILVSGLLKPKDELAIKAELYSPDSLNTDEFEAWYCSPYASTIAYTIEEVIPGSSVRILRRITEVQEGLMRASTSVFVALFVLTFIVSVTTIFSAEKMYLSSQMRELGIMVALGASRQKIFLQLLVEISMASFLSACLAYLLSRVIVDLMSSSVFGMHFQDDAVLVGISAVIPFLTSIAVLIFVKKSLDRDAVEILR